MSKYSRSDLHDEFIESGIVGTILKKPEMYYYSDMVTPNMFLEEEYSGLFWALSNLIKDGVELLDDFTIINKLRESEAVYKIYESSIASHEFQDVLYKLKLLGTEDVSEFKRRVERLISFDFRRKIPNKLRSIADNVECNDASKVNELNQSIHSEIMKLSEKYLVTTELPMLGDVIDNILENIESRTNNNGVVGIPSKFKVLNNFFSYEDCELILIAGVRKEGKSVVLMNEAWHKASQNVPTLIMDTELSTQQWTERLLALITGLTVRQIKSGKLTIEEKSIVSKAIKEIKKAPIAHIYLPEVVPNWSFEDIFMVAKSYQQKMGLKFLIFDYIKSNKISGLEMQEHQYLGDLTEFLKNSVAGRLKIPILASAQMSDDGSRLSDSAKIARYASVVAFWRKKTIEEVISDGKECGTHTIFVKFNRLGRQFEEGEAVNMVADLDRMNIKQSKIQNRLDGNMPYE